MKRRTRARRKSVRPLLSILFLVGLGAGGALVQAEPALFSARRGKARVELVRSRGGSTASEKAVERALKWMAQRQHRDGYWDADGPGLEGKGGGWHGEPVRCAFDLEVTALCTLAFLGAGHTHKDGAHKAVVARAIEWLKTRTTRGTLWGISYATQALAEAYAMSGDKSLRAPVRAGLDTMVDSRQPHAGWRYYAGTRMASGTPTTTAVVTALRIAEEAGFEVDAAYKKPVLKWLDGLVNLKSGRVEYTVNGRRLGYTPTTTNAASALLIRAWLGQDKNHPMVKRHLKAIARYKPKWSLKFKIMTVNGRKRKVQIGYLQHYYWWHGTDALARLDPSLRSAWNASLKKALLPKQHRSGKLSGTWDPVGTYGKVGGRLFSTALCTLALEHYYRYR